MMPQEKVCGSCGSEAIHVISMEGTPYCYYCYWDLEYPEEENE